MYIFVQRNYRNEDNFVVNYALIKKRQNLSSIDAVPFCTHTAKVRHMTISVHSRVYSNQMMLINNQIQ